jgi:malonate decarboxylase gamma subunit
MPTPAVNVKELLDTIFSSHHVDISQNIVFGTGKIQDKDFYILGTIEDTFLGIDEAIVMAEKVLKIIQENNKLPILLIVDVVGQKLEIRDEKLGMYAYFGHLLKCLHLARKQGHVLFSLIYNQAIGGSFIAYGLMADRIYALPSAQLAVMWLDAMSKVIKIDRAILQQISQTSPVFAPGAENFKKLGGLHEVLPLDAVAKKLYSALDEPNLAIDNRAVLGNQLQGRTHAYPIIEKIENQ